jgi:hypothetical protein
MIELFTANWRALEELKACSAVNGAGVGINQPGTMLQFLEKANVDFSLVVLCYRLLDQPTLETVMAQAEACGAGFWTIRTAPASCGTPFLCR